MDLLKNLLSIGLLGAIVPLTAQALSFDQNVTPRVIFGSGNANGSFTVDSANGIELGLRGKLRHNGAGAPENTFNSNGDGTYSFAAGVAPTQAFPTAVWSFEWSINTDVDGTTGLALNDLVYALSLDGDPTSATDFVSFDPINQLFFDHALGNNSTTSGTKVISTDLVSYASNIGQYNVAQNSWKAHWYFPAGFDPTVDGTYDISLSASSQNGQLLAKSSIQIIVGAGGTAVPDSGATLALLGGSIVLLAGFRRRRC